MFKKTGTTIVGLKYEKGVALFADTRATMGEVVADKNCYKLHRIADFMYCAGAGTAADTEHLTRACEHAMALFEKKHSQQPRAATANQFLTSHLHKHMGKIGAALILAAVDPSGTSLIEIHPYGSSSEHHFTSMGSGSLAAMAFLESNFKQCLSEEEAVSLGIAAVEAGILNDLFSGSNVDYVLINAEGARIFRNAKKVCEKSFDRRIIVRNPIKVEKEEIFNFVEEIFE